MPVHKITAEAISVNGLTLDKVKKLGAVPWTKSKSDMLANFLNEHRNLPIVAFNAKYDRD